LCYAFCADEGRKRGLLIAATILAARKLAQYDKPRPGVEAAIADGIAIAERIMSKIDAKYPERVNASDSARTQPQTVAKKARQDFWPRKASE
jgi:hypothetical protein